MTPEMEADLLGMYDVLDLAAESQRVRGVQDRGARAKVTSGKYVQGIVG